MKLTLGFSPCPNDTFIFDALVNHKIDTGGIEFDFVLEDVETLNQWALEGTLDITKLSFPAFFSSMNYYKLLSSGSALGNGVGPLLITKQKVEYSTQEVENSLIAIPGKNTTANLLLSFIYPGAKKKKEMIFSAIEDAVINGQADLGVIIHENRFTYQQKGLYKITDLGDLWEQKMNAPIPLGGIAMQRSFPKSVSESVDKLIAQSLEHSYQHYPSISDFVKNNSQEMSEDVMRKHIELYVNDYSRDLGPAGRRAIETLYMVFKKINVADQLPEVITFLD